MVGCSAAIAAMAGGRLGYVAFGSPMQEPNQEILIVVFLRGGMDGLSVVMPIAGDDRGYYENNRADIAIPTSGTSAALRLTDFFGLHPAGAPLHGLYQDKKLAIIHAAGLYSDTRSHFDAMKYMELGTPDSKSASTGWLTRHLQTAGNLPEQTVMPALSVGSLSPTSLAGSTEAIGMTSPNGFSFGGNWRYADAQRQMLRDMYAGSSWLHEAGVQTLDAIDVVEYGSPGNYTPENGATYPNNSFGRYLQTVAQMVKLQLGLKVATVDLGGWDTHDSQGNGGGRILRQSVWYPGEWASGVHDRPEQFRRHRSHQANHNCGQKRIWAHLQTERQPRHRSWPRQCDACAGRQCQWRESLRQMAWSTYRAAL